MRKIKVLIIDNDEDEQFFIRKGFQATELFEITAILFSGMDLFKTLNDKNAVIPEVIISDLNMHGMNGYDILDEMKSNPHYASIPIIITSNIASQQIVEKCKSLGAFDVKEKPDDFSKYQNFAKTIYNELINQIQQI